MNWIHLKWSPKSTDMPSFTYTREPDIETHLPIASHCQGCPNDAIDSVISSLLCDIYSNLNRGTNYSIHFCLLEPHISGQRHRLLRWESWQTQPFQRCCIVKPWLCSTSSESNGTFPRSSFLLVSFHRTYIYEQIRVNARQIGISAATSQQQQTLRSTNLFN